MAKATAQAKSHPKPKPSAKLKPGEKLEAKSNAEVKHRPVPKKASWRTTQTSAPKELLVAVTLQATATSMLGVNETAATTTATEQQEPVVGPHHEQQNESDVHRVMVSPALCVNVSTGSTTTPVREPISGKTRGPFALADRRLECCDMLLRCAADEMQMTRLLATVRVNDDEKHNSNVRPDRGANGGKTERRTAKVHVENVLSGLQAARAVAATKAPGQVADVFSGLKAATTKATVHIEEAQLAHHSRKSRRPQSEPRKAVRLSGITSVSFGVPDSAPPCQSWPLAKAEIVSRAVKCFATGRRCSVDGSARTPQSRASAASPTRCPPRIPKRSPSTLKRIKAEATHLIARIGFSGRQREPVDTE